MTDSLQPLRGRRIAITRTREQATELADLLQKAGAEAVICPAIRIVPPDEIVDLDLAIDQLSSFDLIVFASANSIAALTQRMKQRGIAFAADFPPVAAVGAATARAAEMEGFVVAVVPDQFVAESLVMELRSLAPGRVLLLRADIGRPLVRDALVADGWDVVDVVAYRTIPGDGIALLARELQGKKIDAITFSSSSSVRFTVEGLTQSGEIHFLHSGTSRPAVICLGPVTAKTARDLGVRVDSVAGRFDARGLADAVADWFTQTGNVNG